jgi:hypothetical protein
MLTRRGAVLSLLASVMLTNGCTTQSTRPEPAYGGPTKTIRGYLRGPPYAVLTPSSVVSVTAYDATGGNSSHMAKIGGTSFTLNRTGYFPVEYEIEIPASTSVPRVALAVEIRRAGSVLFSNDRNFSQTTGRNLDIPMREAPPRIRNFRGRL